MVPRTLHIIASRQPGGAEYFFSRLVNAMHQAGYPTETALSSRCTFADKLDPAITQHRLPMKGVWDRYSRWRINRIIRKQAIDVVQTYLGRAARLTHLRPHTAQLVCRVGGFYKPQHYAHADHWVCNSHSLCEHLVKGGMPATRVHMIPNFVTQPELLDDAAKLQLRQQYGVAADDLLLCSVGRLHSIKGLDTLLRAFAKLRQQFTQRRCRLMLVGDGPQENDLRRLAAELQVEQDLIWTGWQAVPAPFYQIADIAVCASRREGFGNVVAEAWANQVAVLSTAAEGPKELVESGLSGVLVPIDDVDAMARGLHGLASDEALRAELAVHAAQVLSQHYSQAVVVQQYADFYQSICR